MHLRKKLDKKAVKLRFVGYSIQSKAYRLLDEKTSKIYIRRDVIFNEKDFGQKTEEVPQGDLLETIEVEQNPQRQRRSRLSPKREDNLNAPDDLLFDLESMLTHAATNSIPHVASYC